MQAKEANQLLHINGDKSKLIDLKWAVRTIDELFQTNRELIAVIEKLENENAELKAQLERLA